VILSWEEFVADKQNRLSNARGELVPLSSRARDSPAVEHSPVSPSLAIFYIVQRGKPQFLFTKVRLAKAAPI
jgi:hypothetical protein